MFKLFNKPIPAEQSTLPAPEVKPEQEPVLLQLTQEFDRLNQLHFNGSLKPPIIEFSNRKSYGGYYQKLRHRIVLSWQAYREHGLDETMNTFRHEVAHIVHQNHRAEFWNLASALGVTKKYAAAPLVAARRRSRWYTYECPECKGVLHRKRRFKNNASCAKCDSKFNPRYQLKLIKADIR